MAAAAKLTPGEALRVSAVTDGKPGHEKQTRGVIAALSARRPVEARWLAVPGWAAFPAWLRGARGVLDAPPPHLVIGAGRATHLPVLALAALAGARALCCMKPGAALLPFFDLAFIPRHDRAPDRKNIFRTFGPPNPARPQGPHDPARGLVMAGGAGKAHTLDEAGLLSAIKLVISARPGVRFTLGTSRRTPGALASALAELAGGFPNAVFAPAEATPPGWIEARYAESREAWVTADSVSMIYEALTAGCAVGVFPVAFRDEDGKHARGLRELLAGGWVTEYSAWRAAKPLAPPPSPLDEAGRCADAILSRWFP